MSSSYTTSLQIQKIGNGEQSGIWGSTTNTNWDLIEQAVAGVRTITMTNNNYTLTALNGLSDEARNMVLVVQGTNNTTYQVIAPLVSKVYVVTNNTTGGNAITIGASSGSVVSIPNGTTAQVYCDGTTGFYSAQTGSAGNFTINGNLTVTGNQVDVGSFSASSITISGPSSLASVTVNNNFTATAGSVILGSTTVYTGTATATFPSASGTVMVSGNMPAFSVYLNSAQNITSGVATKVQLNVEEFDTNNNFDSTTNYRFTPTVAGYYQINGGIYCNGVETVAGVYIYKNGSVYKNGSGVNLTSATANNTNQTVSSIVYFNGSTDYVELWGTITGSSPQFYGLSGNTYSTYFNGCLLRTA